MTAREGQESARPTAVATTPELIRFPPGFLWGTATAAHQVEGSNRSSDWWDYEQQGRVPHQSGDACRHYELFAQDFDLCRSLGHNAHRLSIEWSRIEPSEGTWDAQAVGHYRDVVRALVDRGLEPIVTLHHFTNPAWFLRRGGWARRDSVALFSRYVEHVAATLDSPVKYWITINEPTVYVLQGYIVGVWPPCLASHWTTAVRVFRNLARAHRAAYAVLRRRRTNAHVGFAHSAPIVRPCNPARARDRAAAFLRDAVLNRMFFHLIGAPRTLDFLGINYYTRTFVRSGGRGVGALVGRLCQTRHHGDDGPVSALGWEVYPEGLAIALQRFSRYGVPLMVTENGVATDDDEMRGEFLRRHLAALGESVANGINVIGYLYWTLMDNYEWAAGTTARFGLASVQPITMERTVRASGRDFSQVCHANAVAREVNR